MRLHSPRKMMNKEEFLDTMIPREYAVIVFNDQQAANGFVKYLRDHGIYPSPVAVSGYMADKKRDQLVYMHDKFEYVDLPREYLVHRAHSDHNKDKTLGLLLECRFNRAMKTLPGALKVAKQLSPHAELNIEIQGGEVYYIYRYRTNWDVPPDSTFSDIDKAPWLFSQDPLADIVMLRIFHDEVRKFELNNTFRAHYGNLWVSVNDNNASIWIRTAEDGDGTSMGAIRLNDHEFDKKMSELNGKAGLANREGYFYCTKCCTVKPISEYKIFYFAAKYCKQCMKDNPDLLRRAQSESYN